MTTTVTLSNNGILDFANVPTEQRLDALDNHIYALGGTPLHWTTVYYTTLNVPMDTLVNWVQQAGYDFELADGNVLVV